MNKNRPSIADSGSNCGRIAPYCAARGHCAVRLTEDGRVERGAGGLALHRVQLPFDRTTPGVSVGQQTERVLWQTRTDTGQNVWADCVSRSTTLVGRSKVW